MRDANGTVISDSRITTSGDGWGIGVRGATGVIVKFTTISGAGRLLEVGIKDVTGSSTITVVRNDISDWTSGVQMSAGIVQGNYIHDPRSAAGYHLNGLTDNGGRNDGTTLTIRHNTIFNSYGQTDAVSLFEDFGTVNRVVVDHNLLAGGSYTLYAGGGRRANPSTGIQITDNRFSTRFLPRGGSFGPVCCFDRGSSNRWTGNSWFDGPRAGRVIPAP